MSDEIRVRFAPSPTGHLHVGGARTALFNWLLARNKGGKFILRIEDTDQERSTEECYRAIVEALSWLGLGWDEGPGVGGEYGPYLQSERKHYYREWAERLLAEGKAYRCFCAPEEVAGRKEEMKKRGENPMYDRRCRDLAAAEIARLDSAGRPHVVRFKMPLAGETTFEDMIHGHVAFKNPQLDDFVLMKSDGFPTYNFAATVDDILMKITHVLRGDDHISNTPRQIRLYQAFGIEPPRFAHVPLIMGSDRTRLGKRHGATSIAQFKLDGYLPEALMNYLALLGWAYDGESQIFTKDDLVAKFSLERVSDTPAVFDYQKLQWLNGEYMKRKSTDEKIEMVTPYLEKAGLVAPPLSPEARVYLGRAVEIVGDRLKMSNQIVEHAAYFFKDEVEYEPQAAKKFLSGSHVGRAFEALEKRLAQVDVFDGATVDKTMRDFVAEMGLKVGDLFQPVRVAITGSRHSPDLIQSMELLGRDRVLWRLRRARQTFQY